MSRDAVDSSLSRLEYVLGEVLKNTCTQQVIRQC